MEKEDVKIAYAYIGYSDGSGDKEGWRAEFYPDMPERILMYFTSRVYIRCKESRKIDPI